MNSMTATIGDYNMDTWMDIYVTNTSEGNILLANNGDETFNEVSKAMGVNIRSLTFGAAFFDADNDTDMDLHVVGGQVNYMFENVGKDVPYNRVDNSWGLKKDRFFNNGLALGDFNGDGYQDIVRNSMTWENQITGKNTFWRNDFKENNYLLVDLEGTTSNRNAIGATVTAMINGIPHVRRIACGESYSSQHSYTQFFGLGNLDQVDSLIVLWPGGRLSVETSVPANSRLKIVEPNIGCNDPMACNYDSNSDHNSAMCRYPNQYYDCDGCLSDMDQDGTCDELEIYGCTDFKACNFNKIATEDDGSCQYLPLFEITGSTEVSPLELENYSYPVNFGSNYSWEVINGSILLGQGSPDVQVLWHEVRTGHISVIETSEENCIGEKIQKKVNISVLGFDEFASKKIILYPSPSNGILNINYGKWINHDFIIQLLDMKGSIILERNNKPERLDLSFLTNGLYVLRLVDRQEIFSSTIQINKSHE